GGVRGRAPAPAAHGADQLRPHALRAPRSLLRMPLAFFAAPRLLAANPAQARPPQPAEACGRTLASLPSPLAASTALPLPVLVKSRNQVPRKSRSARMRGSTCLELG